MIATRRLGTPKAMATATSVEMGICEEYYKQTKRIVRDGCVLSSKVLEYCEGSIDF